VLTAAANLDPLQDPAPAADRAAQAGPARASEPGQAPAEGTPLQPAAVSETASVHDAAQHPAPGAVQRPAPDGDPEPVAETAAEPPTGPLEPMATVVPPEPESEPRRRGRTSLLIAAAAALGVLAGVGTGYQIQYQRPDTPLPPLAQPELKQPKAPAAKTAPLTATEDTLVRTNGDLRKLLVPRPKGAKDWLIPFGDDGWVSLYDYAATFDDPKLMFGELAKNGFRRLADATWTTGGYGDHYTDTEVRLIQFRDDTDTYAQTHLADMSSYMYGTGYAGNNGTLIPGSVDGYVWVYSKPKTEAGYLPQYTARALARQGGIVVDIWITSAKPLSGKAVMSLAKRQLERL
jgi:hypothetical protein